MKISVLAFDGCMTSAVYGLLDAFNIATHLAEQSNAIGWRGHTIGVATPSGGPVSGAGGYRIDAQASLETASESNVVVAPPIMDDVEATLTRERGLIGWLSRLQPDPTLVASACTGAFLLAEAGLLTDRRVTTNPRYRALFESRYPNTSLALEERIVEDRMVICAGATTAYLDLAIHIVDRLGGRELAVSTAKVLSMDKIPGSQRPYLLFVGRRDHGDARVLGLQDWIETHHAEAFGVREMARASGMGERNLTRRFREATRQSPMEYLRNIRMETAKRLLETSPTSLDRVAEAVGYADTRAFIRAFGAVVGLSPGQYRRKFQ
ncbi:MAG TPA: helix-turn-helix domain-containing protein [Phenylobacterium sp.]